MCGIAGYFGKKDISTDVIKSTLSIMSNRGPDSQNFKKFYSEQNNAFLLHSRLSIIDLKKRSNQPYVFKNHVLTFNGEIYNYIELKKHLEKKNYIFLTDSDTEVLIKLYDCYREDSLKLLEGMWAFAIYDKVKKNLILSRDRFGEKPLHIYKTNNGIFFGSETKFIENLSSNIQEPNHLKSKTFLNFGYNSVFLNKQTFKKNIFSINASSFININSKLEISEKKYWKIGRYKNDIQMSSKVASEKVNDLITNSLKIRLRSDVKNIFCLSGGIDSGSLVSIASKKFNMKVDTFSIIDSNSPKYNERHLIEKTLEDTGAKKNFLFTEKINFFETLKKVVKYYNSPVLTVNYLLHALMQKKIKDLGYKVVISGNGADEISAGYYDHYLYHLKDLKNFGTNKEFKDGYADWKKYLHPIIRNKNFKNFNKYFKNIQNPTIKNEYKDIFKSNLDLNLKSSNFFHSDLKNKMNSQIPERLYPILYMDDLNSMMNSIENRTPFLDSKLVEFLFTIPSSIYIQKGYSKYILRNSMKGILNNKIRNARRKYGFNASLSSFKDFTKKKYIEYLYDNIKDISHLINKEKLYKLIKKIDLAHMTDNENKLLFRLISTSMFYSP